MSTALREPVKAGLAVTRGHLKALAGQQPPQGDWFRLVGNTITVVPPARAGRASSEAGDVDGDAVPGGGVDQDRHGAPDGRQGPALWCAEGDPHGGGTTRAAG